MVQREQLTYPPHPEVPENCTTEAMGATPFAEVMARDLVEAMDPENGFEEEYMPYRNPIYNWRLLRLLLSQNTVQFCALSEKVPPLDSTKTYCQLHGIGREGGRSDDCSDSRRSQVERTVVRGDAEAC